MELLDGMKKNSLVYNTKGSKYYRESYDSNLDLFTKVSRYTSNEEIIRIFNNALLEDTYLGLANALYILDIRNGKGERRVFKIIFKYLCDSYPSLALRLLPFISEYGRWDYVLVGIDTKIEGNVIELIGKQLSEDLVSLHPSLLAKWLPSHRTHNKNSYLSKKIIKGLNITEKRYRKMLSDLRGRLNIIEKNLTFKYYDKINFSEVPSKAMLKYTNVFKSKMLDKYRLYKKNLRNGNDKINTEGLFAYEIIRKIIYNQGDSELYDLMWKNQKDILNGNTSNVLVMADTSGSMLSFDGIPYCTAIGLALYISSKNNGIFKDHFMTFSESPYLCKIKGNTIEEKVENIESIFSNTDIDKAFELILNTALENNLSQKDLPSHLIIISDMEFDEGVYSEGGTNFDGWKKAFRNKGYKLPKVIFWNVSLNSLGVPVTKFDNDVIMVSGFSVNLLDNLLDLKEYNPTSAMMEKLACYLNVLKEH